MSEQELSRRLTVAYCSAIKAQHEGSRVEIHLGSDVIEYLNSFVASRIPQNIWGFPVVDTTASPDHISVHVVTTIA